MQANCHAWRKLIVGAAAGTGFCTLLLLGTGCSKPEDAGAPSASAPASGQQANAGSVVLNATQVKALTLATVGSRSFDLQRSAVGSIDFNENATVPIFSPYAGRIIHTFADIGDDVPRGRILYTIDSPDLLQAESTLISDAAQSDLTKAALKRAQDLYAHEGMAQKDYQQAVADQMSAEAALKAAWDAVRIFGKTNVDIEAMVTTRRVDSSLEIRSPVAGRVTARAAQPGLLVQPGALPAPFSVADLSVMWMIANVTENDVAQMCVGESVRVTVPALDPQVFDGRIKAVGAVIDPITHTAVMRAEVKDPRHRLRSGMLATFVIQTGPPVESLAIPVNGVVREGDGTLSAWVSTDRRNFTHRTITVGLQQDGYDQILNGLEPGDVAVIDGAILLSNMLFGGNGDD